MLNLKVIIPIGVVLYITAPSLAFPNIFARAHEVGLNSDSDECLNNSLDSNCYHPQITSVLPQKREATDETSTIDSKEQLNRRLAKYDQVNMDSARQLMKSREFVVWSAEGQLTSLRQILFIHRHGDRTPIQFPANDPLRDEPFWKFHGFGQLTNEGKARLNLLGQMMRHRYNLFLNKSVNKNQRISRSSGSLRCIESAEAFLSSFLALDVEPSIDSADLRWGDKKSKLGQLWQPASIQSVPTAVDGMLAESAVCKALNDEYLNVIDKLDEVKEINEKYKHESEVLNSVINFPLDHFYKWFWAKSQLEIESSYFPDKMDPRLLAVVGKFTEAGLLGYHAYQSTLKSKRLKGGLLINDMIKNMKKMRDLHHKVAADDPSLKKFVHYSAHDLTNVILLGMFNAWKKQGTPEPNFGSNIALELHEADDEWFVRIFYMSKVPSIPMEIHIAQCEEGHAKSRCTLDRFEQVMSPYMIANWQVWMTECENDFSQVDLYVNGS